MKRSVSSVLAERIKQRRGVTPTPANVRYVKFSPEEMAYDVPKDTSGWIPVPGRGWAACKRFIAWKRQMARLEPDVRKAFPDDRSVNAALRKAMEGREMKGGTMGKTRMLDKVTRVLDSGWRGTYGELAAKVGSNPKAARGVATCVKAYADLHRSWPHERVCSKRTGRPAYERR